MNKRGFDEINLFPNSNSTQSFDYSFDGAFDFFVDPTFFADDFSTPTPHAQDFHQVGDLPNKRPKTQHEYLEPPHSEPWFQQIPDPFATQETSSEAYADLLSQSIPCASPANSIAQSSACPIHSPGEANLCLPGEAQHVDLIVESPTKDLDVPSTTEPHEELRLVHELDQHAIRWAGGEVVLTLGVETPIPAVWYCDRPFPHFTLQVLDKATLQPVTGIDNAQVSLRIVNGFGQDGTTKAFGNFIQRCYPICPTFGRASVAGLRFSAVSSKQGGHFQLIAGLSVQGRHNVSAWSSDPIQILSYRLYHAPKIPTAQLTGRDSVAKMKGIGAQYAKRLKAQGIVTVGDLAAIDLEGLGHQKCEELLQRIRKDRGSMTLAKLSEYVFQARDIMERSPCGVEPVVVTPILEQLPRSSPPQISRTSF